MLLFFPYKKATLLAPSSPNNISDLKHLFIILTNPNNDKDVLLVNVSSIRPGRYHDPACKIAPKAHPFIKRDSFIYYRYAQIANAHDIVSKVKSGEFVAYEPVSDELFKSVIDGLLSSKDTSLKVKDFYIAAFN